MAEPLTNAFPMITGKDLVEKIAAQSADYSKSRGLSKPAAAAHLYSSLSMELAAAFDAAGLPYRERVEAILDEQAEQIDRSDDQTVSAGDA